MASMHYAIEMTERSPATPGESEHLSLLVLFAGAPVGAVTIEWHGNLEFAVTTSKFFGGRAPGINNAWQLADLVRRAIEHKCPTRISDTVIDFTDQAGEPVAWEISLQDAGV